MNEFIEKLIGRLEEQKTKYRNIRKNTYCRRTEMDDCDSCRADHYLDARLEGINKAKEIVNELAEEYGKDTNVTTNGWIPCSERLPSYDGPFICTAKGIKESLELIYSSWDNSWMDEFYSEYEVIAWQPLPAPYQKPAAE